MIKAIVQHRYGSLLGRPVIAHTEELLDELLPIAAELGCRSELEGLRRTLVTGASYQRQLAVADAAGGDLRAVTAHLMREFRENAFSAPA